MWLKKHKKNDDNFIGFLKKINNKKLGERVALNYDDGHIKVVIILIAKDTIIHYGTDPYVKYIDILFKNGTNSIYILARGDINVRMAHYIVSKIMKKWKVKEVEEFPRAEYRNNSPIVESKGFYIEIMK